MKDPETALKVVKESLPGVNKLISERISLCVKNTPKGQFLTIEIWGDILSRWDLNIPDKFSAICVLIWQYNKVIYRFNKDLYKSLTENEINGTFPVEVLYKLSYHCIYIDLEDREINGSILHGVWVRLEYHQEVDKNTIVFCLNKKVNNGTNNFAAYTYSIILDKRSITTLVKETFHKALELNENIDYLTPELQSRIENEVKIFLSLILYICSDEPDIISQEKATQQHQPMIKTRHGQKLLPAPKVRIFNVGDEIAKKIQEVNSYESGDKSVRAHIRKAHWHGYWVGKGRSEFKYNWIHPIIVNVEESNI